VSRREGFPRLSEPVAPEEYSRRVSAKLGDLATGFEVEYGHVWAAVDPSRLVEVVGKLKNDQDLACGYLTFIAGVDWQEQGFELVVMLYSVPYANTVGLRVRLPAENPTVPTLTGLFRSADWHEREAHEMFGINFEGHPNMRGLYLPPDFVGHPLLKSFRLASRIFKPWPGAKDPAEAAGGGRA
jgi:NADH-quinone oxidoreductase subunit C